LKSKTVVVVGLGRSGIGAAELLNAEGHRVIVLESGESPTFKTQAERLKSKGIQVALGKPLELSSFQPWLNQLTSVVISPAVPWGHSTLNELRQKGVTVTGEINLAWERLKHLPWIGITGTNGKTTITHMLQHVFESNHLKAAMGGNVGLPATEVALKYRMKKELPDWLIMELSSYQLETAPEISPRIGIWTNLTPDHLERHGSIEAYSNIKRNLLEKSDNPIYNADDSFLMRQRSSMKMGIWISSKGRGSSENPANFWINNKGMVVEKDEELFHSSVLDMPGSHNLQNLLMVTAASRKAGLTGAAIQESIRSFAGVPHRLEKIGCLHGIHVFNDSKATNYESAKMGLMSVASPSVIIAGGQAKEGNPSEWLEQINKRACGIVLFGTCKGYLKDIVDASTFKGDIFCCNNLNQAVGIAIEIGVKKKAKSLLLSPACASFDQYKDYEERGDHFRQLIGAML